jgi:ureidoglycolate lyase
MRTLTTQTLRASAFAPYGAVLGGALSSGLFINAGTSEKIALPEPDFLQAGGQLSLNLYRAQATPLPVVARELERHCLGSQSFIPLAGVPFVVLVALGDPACQGTKPLESSLAAFWLDGSCGVTFNPGTWHHPLLAQQPGDFVVLERKAPAIDCEIKQLSEPVQILAR